MTATVADVVALYSGRYRNRIGAGQRPALLVVDFSLAFTKGFGTFPGGFAEELAQTKRLVDTARDKVPVILSTIAYDRDMRDAGLWAVKIPWIAVLQSDSDIVAIDPALNPRPGEVLVKKYPSCFFGTHLHERLQRDRVDTLVLAGCTTSTCVRASAVDAMQYGYRTILAHEAIGDFDSSLHALHMADLEARYADVEPVEQVIRYLQSAAIAVTD